jgi:hypothetical protein
MLKPNKMNGDDISLKKRENLIYLTHHIWVYFRQRPKPILARG